MGKSSILRRLMIVYFFTFMALPVSYLIRVLYARSLSIEAYGLFYSIIAFLGLVGVFNDLGMNPALVHYLPKFIKNRNFKKIKSAISIVFSVELVTSVLIGIFILSARKFLAESFFKSSLALYVLPIFAFTFLLENIYELVVNIFKGYRKEIFYSSANPLRLFAVMVFSFLAYFMLGENLIVVFSVIWVLSFLMIILLYAWPLARTFPGIYREKFFFDKKVASLLLKYGFFVMLGSAAAVLLGRIDVLMITYFKGVESVAFYEIALPIASVILIVIIPVTAFLFPNISHFYHKRQFGTIKAMLQAIYNTGFFMFLPLGLIFFLFPQEIITVLFGSKYMPAKIALQILSIGFIFKGFSLINFSVVSGIGQVKIKSLIIYLGAAIDVILNLILIPPWGINGAAFATSISFFVMFIASMYHLEKKVRFGPSYRNWIKTILNSALFVAVVYSLKTILDLNLYLEAVIVVAISGIIYLIVGFKWNILDYNTLKKTFFQTIGRG